MKNIYQLDSNGFYLQAMLANDDFELTAEYTTIEPTNGLLKPLFVNGAWAEGATLAQVQSAKIDELKQKCAETIQAGFTSSALGTSHTYVADSTSMIYWNATMHRFLNDSTFTTVNWSTSDAGFLAHNKSQFMQAFNDGHQFGIDQESHLSQLITNVLAAKDVPTVNAITW